MLGMQLMRRRDVDRLDVGVGAQRSDIGLGAGVKVGGEATARLVARIGGRDELDTGMMRKRRQHDGERTAEPGDAQTEFAVSHGDLPFLSRHPL
jgi:hypothetical protein